MKKIFLLLFTLMFVIVKAEGSILSMEDALENDPDNIDLLIKIGIGYHDRATKGDKKAVEKGESYLDRAQKLDPDNPVVVSYLGSILTLKGRDAIFPWTKMKFSEQGIDKIDKAVEMAPDNIRVRIVRALNSLNLPKFFHRLQYTMKDLTYITKLKGFNSMPPVDRAMIYYNLGIAFDIDRKKEQAIESLELAIRMAPESEWGKEAEKMLKNLKN